MNGSERSSWQNKFSHIYVEEKALAHQLTANVLGKFLRAKVIVIQDYKEIFARPNQAFQIQKQSMKLILACKKDRFLYAGPPQSQNFGYRNFSYTALMLNCIYNCAYCYLQGMYPSANLVLFVNMEDFFAATRQAIEHRAHKPEPLYVCISYDTDILAFESIVPYAKDWIEFARTSAGLLIEIRTKSANYQSIRRLDPTPHVILAWTLSPEEIDRKYEEGAPPLASRLAAVQEAVADGWHVRLCFDPVLKVENWRIVYRRFFDHVFKRLPSHRIRDVSVGTFRMNAGYFQRLKKQREANDLVYSPFEIRNSTVAYPVEERKEIISTLLGDLGQYLPAEKIAVWE